MRNAVIVIAALVLGFGLWSAVASWRWTHADMAALFRDRVASETPAGTTVTINPGTLLVGDLSGTARLVCGTASVRDPHGGSATHEYSIVVSKILFGHAINDGFTPAARPENEALSRQSCAALQAHTDQAGTALR